MKSLEKATFAAGCFWGVQASFDRVKGVVGTTVGYTGGHTENPTYKQVCTDRTGHAEAVLVEYDPERISYQKLLEHFFSMHDPTTENRQGPDVGSQYRSAVFYHDEDQKKEAVKIISRLNDESRFNYPIVTEVSPAGPFYRAEDHHQKYFEKNGHVGCHI